MAGSGSTVEITRSGATRWAMRHRPSVPSEPSTGSTSWPAISASSATASAALGPSSCSGRCPSSRCASVTKASTSVARARGRPRRWPVYPVVVVVSGAVFGDHRGGVGHLAAHPADRADQLGHRVLGGHRVIEHRGVQRPPCLTRQRPGLRHHRLDRLEDPVRSIRGRQPAPPVGQRGRVKRPRGDRQPARRLPPQIEGDRIDRLAIGNPCNACNVITRPSHRPAHWADPDRGNRSANISSGNNSRRCAARNANTLPGLSR